MNKMDAAQESASITGKFLTCMHWNVLKYLSDS